MLELSFHEFGLSENTLKGVEKKGFTEPTPIQKLSIPWAIKGFDLLAQAQTGTGKTAAFALPSLSRIDGKTPGIHILVLTPTRELAQQVAQEISELGAFDQIQVATVVGGKSYGHQRKQLKTASVLVATPGRLNDLLNSGDGIPHFAPQIVILDEADRMLDMGFSEDLEIILKRCPEERQTLMFSATFARSILQLSQKYQKSNRKQIQAESTTETNQNITQKFVIVTEKTREEALFRWIDYEQPQKSILFCEMKKDADHLGTVLLQRGYNVSILHGDTEQNRRESIMRQFRHEPRAFLVATDIAARGLDVYDITHVINFQFPRHIESYVHRIGRTGRAGKTGTALSFILPRELRQLQRVEKHTKASVEKVKIPTLSQLREKAIESLLARIDSIPMDPQLEMHLLRKWIEKDFDQEAHQLITLKLMQIHLGDRYFTGPESIDISEPKPQSQNQRFDSRKQNNQRRGFDHSSRSSGNRSRSASGDGSRSDSPHRDKTGTGGGNSSQRYRSGQDGFRRSGAGGDSRVSGDFVNSGSGDSQKRGSSKFGSKNFENGNQPKDKWEKRSDNFKSRKEIMKERSQRNSQ